MTGTRPPRRSSSNLSARRLGEKTQSNSSLSLHSLGAASGSSAGHNPAHPFYKQHESTGSLLDLTPDDLQDPYCPTIKDDVYERSRRIHRRNSYENRRSSERRTSIDLSALRKVDSFHNLVRNERWMDWASSVRRLDPRYQILTYFDDVARDGGILSGIGANRASVLSRLSTTSSNRGSRGSHQMMTSLIDLDGLDGSCRSQARSVISVASSGDGASYAAASIHSAAAQRYNDSGHDEDLDVVARSVARHFAGGAWTTVAKRITLGPSSGGSSPSPGAGSGGGGKGGFRRSFRRLSSGLTAGSRRGSMTSVIEDPPEGTGDGSSNSDAYGNNSSADFRRGSLRRLSSGNFGRRKSATAAALAAAASASDAAHAAGGANSDSSGSRLAARLGASAGSMVSSGNSSSVNDYSSGDLSWQVQQLHGGAQSPLHQHQPQPAPPKKTSRRFRRRSSHSSRSGVRRFRRMRRRASAVLHPELQSPLLRLFNRAGVFTVWRPCSRDAIRAMMTGAATGKGLDVKGKSAKRGDLSGYVPFVQIHEEGHKQRVSSIPLEARTRVFYSSERDQEIVRIYLEEFVARHGAAYKAKYEEEHNGSVPEEMWWTSWVAVDDYANEGCWGIEMSQSLFWEALVASRSIERPEGSRLFTGRPSEPAFQDMNLQTVRLKEAGSKAKDGNDGDGEKGEGGKSGQSQQQQQGGPIAVVWQASNMKPSVEVSPDQDGNVEAHRSGDPLDPRTFLVAYEEKGRVLPVVSDFDCFIMGTRGVQYDYPLPEEQVDLIQWCVSKVEGILDETAAAAAAAHKDESGGTNNGSGSSGGWTSQWLDVLKTEATKSALTGHKTAASSIQVPPYGFGDPTSYTIMEHAVRRLKCGAVRHGAECFNYKFPQEIDDNFLVISDTLPGNVPWKYVSEPELRRLLCQKVNEGFAFPINPKWVLCDPGWKVVYDRLLSSPNENIRKSMDVWFPPDSGLRERIEEVSRRHPRGFMAPPAPPPRSSSSTAAGPGEGRSSSSHAGEREEEACGTEAMDLAELQLRRYLILQRAKRKLRTVLLFRRLGMEARERARQTDGETTETTKKTTMLQETTGPEEEDNDNDNNDNEGNIDGNGNGNSNGNGDGNDKKKKDGTTSDGNENDSHGTERGESPSPTLPPVSAAKSLVVGPMID